MLWLALVISKHGAMLKKISSRLSNIKSKQLSAALVVIIVAAVGTYLLVNSHAASPYASITADKGTLANGATSQACAGASDGNCVVFGDSSGSTGGGGSSMIVGVGAGGWGPSVDDDVASNVKFVRLDEANCSDAISISYPVSSADYTECPTGGDINELVHDGAKADIDFSGPYTIVTYGSTTNEGISSLNATTWANNALSWYKAECTPANCPTLEVLNEPGGTWFWGNDALSQTNADAYANLVKVTYTTFHTAYGSSAPFILATFDGSWGSTPAGVPNNEAFGHEWWNASMSNYVNGIVVHTYGGNDASSTTAIDQSAAGDRQDAEDAHSYTGKPIYITEVGWPTDNLGATVTAQNDDGDSLQWPEADSAGNQYPGLDQCDNVYNFLNWARGTGYVNAVTIFGDIDYGTNDFYGMERYNNPAGPDLSKKPSWYALGAAARNLPNPCPGAANHYAIPSTF
jgi:hypothetical protein